MVAQNRSAQANSAQANQASTGAPVITTQPHVAGCGEPIVQKPRREIDEAFRQLTDYHGDLPPKHELLFSFYISHLEHHRSQVAPVLRTQEQIADAFRQIAGVDRNPNMPYTGAIPPPAREGRLLTRFWQAHLEHHTRIAAAAAAADEPPQQQQKQGEDSDDDGEPPAIRTAAILALGVGFGTTVTAILAHQQILFPKKVEAGGDAKYWEDHYDAVIQGIKEAHDGFRVPVLSDLSKPDEQRNDVKKQIQDLFAEIKADDVQTKNMKKLKQLRDEVQKLKGDLEEAQRKIDGLDRDLIFTKNAATRDMTRKETDLDDAQRQIEDLKRQLNPPVYDEAYRKENPELF